jgi:tetratricopeptide (TPR) repeat protein
MAIKEYRASLLFNPSNALVARKLKRLEEGGTALEVGAWKLSKPRKKSKRVKGKTDLKASANTHYMRGKVYLESTAYPEAIEEFNTAREFVPDFLDTATLLERTEKRLELQIDRHFKKGISYFQKEEMKLAVEEWDSVLRLRPSHKDAEEYKGRAELIMERVKSIKERQGRQEK